MYKYTDKIGRRGRELVTGVHGVIVAAAFDLYGCVQLLIQPEAKGFKFQEPVWFDHKRVDVMKGQIVSAPEFDSTHLEKLGLRARDRLSGYEGVVTSVVFVINGVVRLCLTAEDPEGDDDSHWFDDDMVKITGKKPIMTQPVYDEPGDETGPAPKPKFRNAI